MFPCCHAETCSKTHDNKSQPCGQGKYISHKNILFYFQRMVRSLDDERCTSVLRIYILWSVLILFLLTLMSLYIDVFTCTRFQPFIANACSVQCSTNIKYSLNLNYIIVISYYDNQNCNLFFVIIEAIHSGVSIRLGTRVSLRAAIFLRDGWSQYWSLV